MKKLGSSGFGSFPQAAKVKLSDFLRNEEGKVGSRAAFGAASMAFAGATAAMLTVPNTAEAAHVCSWRCYSGRTGYQHIEPPCTISRCRYIARGPCASHGGVYSVTCYF